MDKKKENPLISVIIPACNEEKIIGEVIGNIKSLNLDCEILVIDDGSTDNTKEVAETSGARVIQHPYNIGNGASVKTGARNAQGKILITMDGDGQHNPEDIPGLIKEIGRYDMVVGARSNGSQSSFHRNLANKIYNLFSSYLTFCNIQDLTSGFRAIKRDVMMKFLYLLPNTFSYPTTITLALIKAGHRVKYIPIETKARVGTSKIRIFDDGLRFFLIILKIAALFSPFKVFFPISFLIFMAGMTYGSYMIILQHHFSNMVLLLLLTGILIFLLGLVAEQIAMLRMERSENI